MSDGPRRVARHATVGGVTAAAGASAGIGLMDLLFSPAVTFFGRFIEVEEADTGSAVGDALAGGFGALGAVLAAVFFAAVVLLTVVVVMPLTTMGLALGASGFERAWLAVLITLPLSVVGFLLIGQLLPGSVPWWLWPAVTAVAAAVSVWLAAAVPTRSRRRTATSAGVRCPEP
ncbi:hypothetical protein G5C66_15895 [Nocardioides sp. KC13]|uniref:Uncharacterized protein n=1 Tax=Nocardioides turkmenicus TaxID=2711220 RepID=A0A6M1QW88_9ACTN|nr:hypothetical protein [Nocardioides sp. KC13]NGN94215.1 hypothetical protein [Nocardioides sp. KC13]